MRTEELFHWIKERWRVRQARAAGKPKPWTTDPILQNYRFCHIHREDDRVTKWITDNWRTPHTDDPDFWFAAYVARVFNLPGTLAKVGYPVPFTATVRKRLAALKGVEGNVFNAAYIVSTNGIKMNKLSYYADVFDKVWARRKELRPVAGEPLAEFANRLVTVNGIGTFMAGQVIADAKFAGVLLDAPDWYTFAVSGPGSRRGLNWVCGREFDAPWREADWHARLMELMPLIDAFAKKNKIPEIDAQNGNNVLCETSKTVKILQGWGRPKQKYAGI